VGVLYVVALVVNALALPPDPFTQLAFLAAALPVVAALATGLSYGGGFARAGLSPTNRDHAWTAVGFVAVVFLVGLLVPDPTALAAVGLAIVLGLLAGPWLGYGRGRERLRPA
jgi:hypothetical protein